MTTMQDQSRKFSGALQAVPTLEQVTAGSVLRIADAVEKMAANYDILRDDRDYWKARCARYEQLLDIERRRTAVLRGVVKRMKEKAS
jgi:hypothetical protein